MSTEIAIRGYLSSMITLSKAKLFGLMEILTRGFWSWMIKDFLTQQLKKAFWRGWLETMSVRFMQANGINKGFFITKILSAKKWGYTMAALDSMPRDPLTRAPTFLPQEVSKLQREETIKATWDKRSWVKGSGSK